MDYVEAFFEDLERKVSFLQELFHSGHQDEAATLCYVYVDGLGYSLYWPMERSAFTFVRVLCECGQQPFLAFIHPKGLIRWLQGDRKLAKPKALAGRLETLLVGRVSELFEKPKFRGLVLPSLTQQEAALFEKELWRGTLANAAYEWLQNPFVHRLRGYGGLSFDSTTYQGKPVPDIEFDTIYSALLNIVQHARRVSEISGKFCGHNFSRKALAASKCP